MIMLGSHTNRDTGRNARVSIVRIVIAEIVHDVCFLLGSKDRRQNFELLFCKEKIRLLVNKNHLGYPIVVA